MPALIALAVGALAGAIAALCGVGGGIIMVPAFRWFLQMEQRTAVATSLAAIIATAIAATLPNASGPSRLVDWNVAMAAGLGGAVVAYFAGDWLKKLSNQTLEVIFALVIIAVGLHMLWRVWRG